MKNKSILSILLLFITGVVFSFTSCSKESPDETKPSSLLKATEVAIHLVNEQQEVLTGDATVIISKRRPDVNMLVPREEKTVNTGKLTYRVFEDTEIRITVLKKGYNPIYKDIIVKPSDQTISIVLTPKSGLTVLSYNVKDGFGGKIANNLTAFSNWVSKLDPDVIVFQELVGFKKQELQEFAKTYGHDFSYLLKEEGYPTGITSKQEIKNAESILIKSNYPPNRVHGFIRAETFGLNILAVHFSSQSNDLVFQEANYVVDLAKELEKNGPVLIAGDFNSITPVDEAMLGTKAWLGSMQKYRPSRVPFDYRTMKLFEDSPFKDAISQLNNKYYKASFPTKTDYLSSDFLGFRLDYCYLSESLAKQCDYVEILQDSYSNTASDHYPYLMHFKAP
ncbi:endonuclease/exonuclease/phosphatase family protein [Sphingobacterium lactis]|uniref:endonuclease/exonuclease/phosphatase family protein n=1 Tax=Sphingobacterium lactis TaxID=797291 RepID=UPI003F7F5BD4